MTGDDGAGNTFVAAPWIRHTERPVFSDLSTLWVNRGFRSLISARFISNVGNGMAPIALAFGVLSLPGADGTSLSYVTASQMVPIVGFLLIGGVLADRIGRARMVGGTDLIGSILVCLNGILFITGNASVLQLCITGFGFGILNALWYPAFSGLLPQVVEPGQLQSANSLVGFSANIGFTLGASVAGVLVSSIGPGWAILIDGGTFFVAGVLVWQLRRLDTSPSETHREASVVSQMKEGWQEFRSRRWLVVIVATFSLINMCFEAFLAVLAPLQMKESLGGARDMGFMMFAWGLGSMVGVVFSMRLRARRPLITAMGVMPLMGIWMALLAIPVHLVFVLLFAVGTGIAIDIFYVLWMTSVQTHVPAESLSRVGSFDAFGSNLLVPVGLLIAGPLASSIGVRPVLLGAATAVCLLSLGSLLSAEVRSVRRITSDVSASTE